MKKKAKTGEKVTAKGNAGINVELLCAVSAAIERHPEMFDINIWCSEFASGETPEEPCVQTCLAGWTLLIHQHELVEGLGGERIHRRATELLRLTEEQAERLFYRGMWPWEMIWPKGGKGYCDLPLTPEDFENNARLACRRIEIFIKTNGEI